MSFQDRMLKRLIGADPSRAVEGMLQTLVEETHALGAALFTAQDPPERVAHFHGDDDTAVARTLWAWTNRRDALSRRRPCLHTRWCVWPVQSTRGAHLVYLASENDLHHGHGAPTALSSSMAEFATALSVAANSTAAVQAAIDSWLVTTSDDMILRRKLVALLEQHSGNKSAVARNQQVSRIAIHRRCKRYGIDESPA
jgi:hypothetical protein